MHLNLLSTAATDLWDLVLGDKIESAQSTTTRRSFAHIHSASQWDVTSSEQNPQRTLTMRQMQKRLGMKRWSIARHIHRHNATTYTWTHIHIQMDMLTHSHKFIHTCTHAHIHIHICTHISSYTHTHIHMHINIYIYIHIYTCIYSKTSQEFL